MALVHVRGFVGEQGGQLFRVLHAIQDPAEHHDVATGHGEGIDLIALHEVKAQVELLAQRQLVAKALERRAPGAVLVHAEHHTVV